VVHNLVAPQRPPFPLFDEVAVKRFLLASDRDVPLALFDPSFAGARSIVSSDEALRLAVPI